MTTLTQEQVRAYDAIHKWFKDPHAHWKFTVHGYAGTGKTWLLQYLINNWEGEVICCAPTGKAASVLKAKLDNSISVTTVHSLLYKPLEGDIVKYTDLKKALSEDPDNKKLKAEVEDLRIELTSTNVDFHFDGQDFKGQLIIVDESSMVTSQMRDDFESTGARVIFVGDGGQLPPVGDDGWFINEKPDALLQDVQRQALDNPIIRLSMEVRTGRPKMRDYQYDNCMILKSDTLPDEEWLAADQIITGMNVTRRGLNSWLREELGYGDHWQPLKGERLVCLKNMKNTHFVNGIQMECLADARQTKTKVNHIDVKIGDTEYLGTSFYDFHCRVTYEDVKEEPYQTRLGLVELDFAYAITCHKAQGSEWDSVILADDNMRKRDKENRRRWLYTGVTRAKEKLVWVKNFS